MFKMIKMIYTGAINIKEALYLSVKYAQEMLVVNYVNRI